MGIAIKIPDVDFSALNLGQVTTSSIPVTAISIQGESSVTGTTDAATYSVTYTPSNTTQQGVIWSIDSGSQYASINASTGKLTILSGANNSAVRIKATSTYNSSVVATKDISVTYTSQVIPLVSLSVTGDDTINNANNSATYDVTYNPSNTTQRGVTWSITSGSEYATINASTGVVSVLAGASSASVTIKATSSVDSTKFATKTITCTYQSAVIPVTAIAISGASTIDDDTNQSTYSVTYTPNNTTQTGVTWSIESGGTYASINASTGVVSVLSGASSASVVIKATSTHNASVVATKTITCTYHAQTTAFDLQLADACQSLTNNSNHIDSRYSGDTSKSPSVRLTASSTRLSLLASRSVAPNDNILWQSAYAYTDIDSSTEAAKTYLHIPSNARGVHIKKSNITYSINGAIIRNQASGSTEKNMAWTICFSDTEARTIGWEDTDVDRDVIFGEFTGKCGSTEFTLPQNDGNMYLCILARYPDNSAITPKSLTELGFEISLIM